MKHATRIQRRLIRLTTAASVLMTGVCLAGPNLVAVGVFDLPPLKAEGRDASDGRTVIFEFPGEHDFGRVYVQSSSPRSVVRRDFQVFYTGQALVINLRDSNINSPVIWVEFDLKGQVRPGRTYEYELEASADQDIRDGVPAILPAMWVDGKPVGATIMLKTPIQDSDKIQRMRYVRGTVEVKHFDNQTGNASLMLKIPQSVGGYFYFRRFSFREVDQEIVEGRSPEMPVPLRYIPIKAAVERQIDDALTNIKAFFKNGQNQEGFWNIGELDQNIYITALIASTLAELGEPADEGDLLKAMRWLTETNARDEEPSRQQPQAPTTGQPGLRDSGSFRGQPARNTDRAARLDPDRQDARLTVRPVAARLYALSRFGRATEFRQTIAADVEFLSDAQYPDGGWSDLSYTDHAGAATRYPDHTVTAEVMQALKEAVFAGVPCDKSVWLDAGRYWLEAQAGDGGFRQKLERYGGAGEATTIGRTAVGLAGSMAALEMGHGPGGGHNCRQYRGNRPLIHAIEDSIAWLDQYYGKDFKFEPRLSMEERSTGDPFADAWALQWCASVTGIQRLRGEDYIRDQAARILERYSPQGLFGGDLFATARSALLLASASAPTVFQRIVLGTEEAGPAELSGDAQHLVRYLMAERKKALNWRRVTLDPLEGVSANEHLRFLLEVPMLYVNVVGPVEWTPERVQRIRDYAFNGGVLLVNVDEEFENQRDALMSGLRQAFPEYETRPLPSDHPLYNIKQKIDKPLAVKAIGNGVKDFVFLLDKDWSCTYHLYETKQSPEAFALVDNLLQYTTDETPFRNSFAPSIYDPGASSAREFRVAHFETGGSLPVYPDLLNSLNQSMQTNYRTNIVAAEQDPAPLLWVSITGDAPPTPEQKSRIMDHIRSGGYLLMDVIGGKEGWAEAAESFIRQLDPKLALRHMQAQHPIYTGKIAGTQGFDLRTAPLRKALTSQFVKFGRNEFKTILLDGQEVGALSTYDIASGVGYNLFPGCRGLRPDAARELAVNTVLYAMQREFQH